MAQLMEARRKYSLLVVQDEEEILSSLRDILCTDYEVLEAPSAAEAMLLLERQPVELILAAQERPGIAGLQFLSRVKERYPRTVRLLLADACNSEALSDSMNSGVIYRYLARPWQVEDLCLMVDEAAAYYELVADKGRMVADLQSALHEKEKALELAELKDELLATMAHELRTPLSAILGYAESLSTGLLGATTEDQDDCGRAIMAAGGHMLAVVDEILQLARFEAGKVELHLTELVLAEALAEVLGIMGPLTNGKTIRVESAAPEPVRVEADARKVKQVLFNLLSNALKFTPPKGDITIRLAGDAREAQVSVADSGRGIPAEEQPLLFHSYQRLANDFEAAPGSGLGLFIARKLVELHGGRIWAEGEPGRGSVFTFTLPRKQPLNRSAV